MNIDKHSTIARLRSAIRTQESLSRDLRVQINTLRSGGSATGPLRSELHQRKQGIGRATRALLLALAMVRGRPLASQEPTSRTPIPSFDIANAVVQLYTTDANGRTSINWSVAQPAMAQIDAWAKGGPSPVTRAEPMAVAA